MAKITFIQPNGETVVAEKREGSVMQAAVENGVEGIDAECGGVCSCATCHVHVNPDWKEKAGKPGPAEAALLELEDKVCDQSRLSCQMKITDALDGLVVNVVGR